MRRVQLTTKLRVRRKCAVMVILHGGEKGSGVFFSFHHHLFEAAVGVAGWIPDEDVPPFCAPRILLQYIVYSLQKRGVVNAAL